MNKTASVLRQLVAAYTNTQVSDETVAIYIRLLRDIPADDLQTIVDQSIAECKFLPTVAEIRDRWHSLTRGLGELTSAEAWGMVMMEIRRVGYTGAPHFESQKVARVVKMIGWRELCMSEEPGIDRAQFMRMYDQVARREDDIHKLLPQARALAAHRGLVPIGDSLRALVESRKSSTSSPRAPEVEPEVQTDATN